MQPRWSRDVEIVLVFEGFEDLEDFLVRQQKNLQNAQIVDQNHRLVLPVHKDLSLPKY